MILNDFQDLYIVHVHHETQLELQTHALDES